MVGTVTDRPVTSQAIQKALIDMSSGTAPLSNLPLLRQELALHRGPSDAHGAPSWTLHDPSDNRFFHISWPAFEILSRWSLGQAHAVICAVNTETTLDIAEIDIETIFIFLQRHHLLIAKTGQDSIRLNQALQATRMGYGMWLLKNYLFVRIPLVRPMFFLRALSPHITWLFTVQFWVFIASIASLGLLLVAQQWDYFTHTFSSYTNWQGVLGIAAALSVAKIAHELGHALTAYRYGCRVPTMGVAFMVLVPMLYTDTNEAWKLASRRARLQISAAGMAAEIALAACATVAWNVLPDGPLRAGAFLLATSTWILTLTVNLSPFMRFDGYFLLCDWLETPNLHERSFALGRWRLRNWLFGWTDPAPEIFSARKQNGMIAFAYAVWVYRLVLFLGIAFVVYSLFFKALGIALLVVELGWFIVLPIQREIKAWWQQRSRMRWNNASRRSIIFVCGGLLLLLMPLPRGVHAPAVLSASQAQWLYAPAPAQLRKVHVSVQQNVQANQILFSLDSPDLQYHLAQAQAREQQLRWQVEQQPFATRLQERGATLTQRWESTQQEVVGLLALGQQLELRADFSGLVVGVNDTLRPGSWIARGERMAQIASPDGVKVDAYIEEAALSKITAGTPAWFRADNPAIAGVQCQVDSVDRLAVAELEHLALASPYGGPITAKLGNTGHAQPHAVHFRVRLHACKGLTNTHQEWVGTAVIGRAYESFATQWLRSLSALIRREASL